MKRLPVTEMFYLPVKPVSQRKYQPLWKSLVAIIIGVLIGFFLAAFVADNILGLTNIARAETIEPTHDNAYYCKLIKETGEGVIGADQKEITKLCL